MFLYVSCAVVHGGDLIVGYSGVCNDGDGDASLCQVFQGQSSNEIVDRNDDQVIQCLEHVGAHLIFPVLCIFLLYEATM
jgi:hypothetical protein